MDREVKGKGWGWLLAHMPGVARQLAEKRDEMGADWVNTCWKQGVVCQEPGWFFVAEGPLSVGTPWPDMPGLEVFLKRITQTQSLVCLRQKDGAHV